MELTDKEAIKILNGLIVCNSRYPKFCEALEMGIKAIEQPFDQILWERDCAIEQLKELGYELGQKPKTFQWITTKIDYDCWCRECRYRIKKGVKLPLNCPNCGADMRGEE